jgi:transposase
VDESDTSQIDSIAKNRTRGVRSEDVFHGVGGPIHADINSALNILRCVSKSAARQVVERNLIYSPIRVDLFG